MDKDTEISREKAATTALNALQQLLGRINVEKTSEQCFRPPLPPKNQKAVGGETETQVPS